MAQKHVRMVTASIKPGKLDEAVELWKTTIAPEARQQKGFVSARMLVDRAGSRVRSIGVWETEDDFKASIPWNQKAVASFAAEYFAGPPTIDAFEMTAEFLA